MQITDANGPSYHKSVSKQNDKRTNERVVHCVLLGGGSTLIILLKKPYPAALSTLAVCNEKFFLEVSEPLRGVGSSRGALPTVSAVSKAFIDQVCCVNHF